MKRCLLLITFLISIIPFSAVPALEVKIAPALDSVDVVHEGEKVTIQRNQNRKNKLNPYYAYTSRKCPPFCIQPIVVAPGVETVGELEVLEYLKRIANGDKSLLVIDARTSKWPKRGMIPGAVNIPWTTIDMEHADKPAMMKILVEKFGVEFVGDRPEYTHAKTLVLYCNGMWCSQSTRSVTTLLKLGYPAERLKWYRGGMQNWENLGLTTVKAEE